MNRRPDALLLIIVIAGGYLAAAPRSEPQPDPTSPGSVIPAVTSGRPIDSPVSVASGKAAGTQIGAPPDSGVAQLAERRSPVLRAATEVAGSTPAPGVNGGAPSETLTRPGASGLGGSSPSPSASPQALRKPAPARRVLPKPMARYGVPWLSRSGIASHMGYGFPASYLALPHGPGWHVRICGAGGCVTRWSNDAGPALYLQRQGRVADLSVTVFEEVCGVPSSRGLCPVSVTVLGHR